MWKKTMLAALAVPNENRGRSDTLLKISRIENWQEMLCKTSQNW
jgi:hypothetical protein